MFCSNCGKQNNDGLKFCVGCGAPLTQAAPETVPVKAPAKASISSIFTPGRKNAIVALFTIIVLVAAALNIVSVYRNTFSISVRDEAAEVDSSKNIYETNSYLYYTTGNIDQYGLYRIDKITNSSEKLTNKSVEILAAASNYVICSASDGNWYKVADKSGELDLIGNFTNYEPIIRGRYYYTVTSNGVVSKHLNNDNYDYFSQKLNNSHSGQYVEKKAAYKNYMYMLLRDSSSNESELIRVSLKSGKEESLKSYVSNFDFSGNYIIYQTTDAIFGRMSLDGSNDYEYLEIEPRSSSFCCNEGYVYYSSGLYLNRFNVESGANELLDCGVTNICGISEGLAYLNGSELHLLDLYGNEIAIL